MTNSSILAATVAVVLFIGCGDAATQADTAGDSGDASDTGPDAVDSYVEPDVNLSASDFCQGTTTFAWDPSAGTFLAAWPDDALTRDDASSLTGLRVDIGEPAWLDEEPSIFQPVWRQLDELDGWGTSAGVVLRFDAAVGEVPSGSAASLADLGLRFYDIGDGEARRVAFETQVIEDGKTVILWPMQPLRERTLHAVVMTRDHLAADGACVAPSPALQALVGRTSSDAKGLRLIGRADTFFARTGIARADVSALTLFTTQDISTVTLMQRDVVNARSYAWKAAPTCATKSAYVECKGTFDALDMRREGYLGDALEPVTYTLPVRIWLPKNATGPVPVLVFGHGLGGDASQAAGIAAFTAPLGMATVALPAPRHGDHPTANSADPNAFFLDLLGIDLEAFTIDGFVFRENVRQAVFDKLQMMALLAANPDVDGKDGADLDLDRVAYWGISLGGIMGGDFSSLSDKIDATILSIPGARVLSIVTDAAEFSSFKDLLVAVAGSEDAMTRLAPVGQALVDAGDPVNWVPHLIRDRLDNAPRAPPHLLVQMVIDDGVVPNVTTRALVRAIGVVDQVPPVLRDIDPLSTTAAAPITANLEVAASATTIGLFQFDRVSTSPGRTPIVATHNNVFSGIEALDQVSHFLETWLSSEAPEIIDPYELNNTPPLP